MERLRRQRIVFPAPEEVEVQTDSVEGPCSQEVLVRTLYSAISPGTERLVYQGNLPDSVAVDASIEALREQGKTYPLSYGYACVGIVEQTGAEIDASWEGTPVFAFQPHVSRFVASPSSLVPIPSGVNLTDAVMIPSVETAVNLLMDGRPMIGEKVVVFGQGVVGLLTTALLNRHPLEALFTSEPSAFRRRLSTELGASKSCDPDASEALFDLLNVSGEAAEASETYEGADLVYELTGVPSVFNDAIQCTGYGGRIVIGSWYGTKKASIDLGGRFHRSRMRVISSQVSTIDPTHRGRWTKDRRMQTVVDLLADLSPGRLITHRFSLEEAPLAYEQLVADDEFLQPIFEYT